MEVLFLDTLVSGDILVSLDPYSSPSFTAPNGSGPNGSAPNGSGPNGSGPNDKKFFGKIGANAGLIGVPLRTNCNCLLRGVKLSFSALCDLFFFLGCGANLLATGLKMNGSLRPNGCKPKLFSFLLLAIIYNNL